jgi:sugar/nucleoside kinase (ribokinase family)
MNGACDILGLGCVAIDDLLYVAAYPPADSKVRVGRRERQCGGLTATALVAAARLGASCRYAATLGDDELSAFVVDCLHREGIDTTLIRRRPGARPIHSVIVIGEDRRTRTIFYDLDGVLGAQADWPDEADIRAARVLFVDHFGVEGMARAARIARAAGIPVVADFESEEGPGFAELLGLANHLIVSQDFAARLTGASDPRQAATGLWTADRDTVVVTAGAQGCWYLGRGDGGGPRHQAAFAVPVVDTTGCGDVFHGAYAAALAGGRGLPDRIRFATAVAALKATRRGGQAGCPTCDTVEAFLKEHLS